MDLLRIEGGPPLNGAVRASGAKNATLPIMTAALLIDELTRTFVGIDLLRIGLVEDRKLRLLTGADLAAEALCLPIGHPVARPIATLLGSQP